MAQYGHNWYGTAYYGQTNAFSGWYQTKEIFTDELLKNTVNINIQAKLPYANYAPNSPEVSQVAGTWTYDSASQKIYSRSTNAELYIAATCDELVIKYEQRTISAKVDIQVTTTEVGKAPVITNFVLNTQAASVNSNATYKVPVSGFAQHQVKIKMAVDSPVDANFNFKGFNARTANLVIESRARTGAPATPGAPSGMDSLVYTKLATTTTLIEGENFTVSAVTPSYVGKNNIQFKIYLASSDNETSPEIDFIELVAGDSDNRTLDGEWSAVFNMEQIAILAGVSFSKVEEVVWTEVVPATTSLTIRSQSSINNTTAEWSLEPKTVPYRKNVNRIRLKEGYLSGWIESPVNAPASKKPYVKTVEWTKWDDQSYLPPDSAGVSLTYDFISPQKDNISKPYLKIPNPMQVANRNLVGNKRLLNLDNVIRVTLSRTAGKQTPVVDFIKLTSKMLYSQDVETEDQEFSAVDFNNTGKGIALDMSQPAFQGRFIVPSEAGSIVTYKLTDATGKPNEVMLYLDSEKTQASRTNRTTTLANKVWVEAKARSKSNPSGVFKHYQYGGGQVSFPLKNEIVLVNTFTPTPNPALRYRYHLDMGWPTQYHKVVAGELLDVIATKYGKSLAELTSLNTKIKYNNDGSLVAGQSLTIPNSSMNNDVSIYWKSTLNQLTQKSSTNAILEGNPNVESDSIVAEVAEASIYGWVDWVSEEKIYDGFVNPNDIRKEYKRAHTATGFADSARVEYVAISGDTYKKIANAFGVYEDDIRKLNDATLSSVQPTIGQRITVPSKITLPYIHPKAIVADNPYKVELVYNSVKKKNGKILSRSSMSIAPVDVVYRKVRRTGVEVVRGQIANGQDLLPESRVVNILKVKSGVITYNKNVEFVQEGNAVSWSLTGGPEPAAGTTYLVDYEVEIPYIVTITIDTNYIEEGGVDRIWRSPEVKEFEGMCYPGKDYVVELPAFSSWLGLPNASIEDIGYIVEDNDIWVKTWVEKRGDKWYVIGSLQDRVPKDNWFPTIKTGYYYLGQDEYYLFNEPITIEPTDKEIPMAQNVEFVEGKFQNAAQLQEGSQNIVRNSGFDIMTTKKTVFKQTF